MVRRIAVINLKAMDVQARILASVKANLAIWQGLAGEGLGRPQGLNGN